MIHYRPETSDERVIQEVIENRTYRKASIGFDVEQGEHWLDLGANIGAFALYCQSRGATAECFEPDAACYELLRKNVPSFTCHQVAITASNEETLPFHINTAARWGKQYTNYLRGCVKPGSQKFQLVGQIVNRHGEFLRGLEVDGCKMDIEGSEGGLIDSGFIPQCKKFVVEYHLSHDPSAENLKRRLEYLGDRFAVMKYPTWISKFLASGESDVRIYLEKLRGYVWIVDPVIFCKV